MRISKQDYKNALKARYKDLRGLLRAESQDDRRDIEPDDKRLQEMRILKTIAKLNGYDAGE